MPALVLQHKSMPPDTAPYYHQFTCLHVPHPQNRLAYLTNKCYGDADLEYYIAEAGHILGVRAGEEAGARSVLAEVGRRSGSFFVKFSHRRQQQQCTVLCACWRHHCAAATEG